MRYADIVHGFFLSRPNRFVAHVELEGTDTLVHVKNTGRCRELLVPGAEVWLTPGRSPGRKTAYDLIAVEKRTPSGTLLVNMDSQAPNPVFREWAEAGSFRPDLTLLKSEVTWGSSRFDFCWESPSARGFVEVKGVTLEEGGIARFPDAPTQRGVKHVEELIRARSEGLEAALCFIVQMSPMLHVEPNDATHPEFGAALRRAAASGVEVFALECRVTPDSLQVWRPLPVIL